MDCTALRPSNPTGRRRDRAVALTLLLLTLGLAGCPPGEDPPDSGPFDAGDVNDEGPRVCDVQACSTPHESTLLLGNGVVDSESGIIRFREIEPGSEVDIVPGFQGGQHIWVVLRAQAVESCWVTPRYQILDDGAEPVLDAYYGGEFYELSGEPGTYEFLAYAAFVAQPSRVHRKTVTLRAEVSNGCGETISAEVDVIPVDARLDQ